MTREEAKLLLPLIQAFAAGAKVQVRDGCKWRDLDGPAFNGTIANYRIKPEPREFWVNEFPNEGLAWYPSRDEAIRSMANGSHIAAAVRIAVHYREVIE